MKLKFITATILGVCGILSFNCSRTDEKKIDAPEKKELSQTELIERGKYLTTVSGCHDCHTPKVMTPAGPELDTTRLLSGHPKDDKVPAVIKTQDWVLFSNDLTAAAGPWGVSYSANLTPDDTGIGNWTFEQFKTAIREGKSKGLQGSRPLLPPMPWQMIRNMTDTDLKSIFAYLKSLPPIDNLVPAPTPPDNRISKNN